MSTSLGRHYDVSVIPKNNSDGNQPVKRDEDTHRSSSRHQSPVMNY